QAHDRHLKHFGMQRQTAFDLYRGNILAPGDDHVIDAASDEEVTVCVKITAVTGEVPALAQRIGIGVRPLPVPLESFVTGKTGNDLALFTRRGRKVRINLAELHHADALVKSGATCGAGLGW